MTDCKETANNAPKRIKNATKRTVLQTFMLAVFTEESQNVQNETGPIDDGFIANAVGSLPSDPLCCAGPEPLDDGTAPTPQLY